MSHKLACIWRARQMDFDPNSAEKVSMKEKTEAFKTSLISHLLNNNFAAISDGIH